MYIWHMERSHIHKHSVNINSAFKTGIIVNIILIASEAALTVHISTNRQTEHGFIVSIQQRLHELFNIGHATIQIEYGSKEDYNIQY